MKTNDVKPIDMKLINLVQEDFPLTTRPFCMIGNELGISEVEVIERLQQLKEDGYIRRIGGFFDSKSLGYMSTLCAMKVEEARIEAVADIINSYAGVTHNYIRDNEINMWFTLTAESKERLNNIIEEIKNKTNINNILVLNSTKTHKVKVHFCI